MTPPAWTWPLAQLAGGLLGIRTVWGTERCPRTELDGIDFDFDSADCLRQAAKMAGLNLEVPEMTTEQASRWAAQHLEPRHTLEMEVGAGLLVYERPGQVTPDAKGHWHTLRRGKVDAKSTSVGK
eukprot:g4581.t1